MTELSAGGLTLAIRQEGTLSFRLEGQPLSAQPQPMFVLWLEGVGELAPGDMTVSISREQEKGWEMLTVKYEHPRAAVRVDWLAQGEEIRAVCTLQAFWPEGIPARAALRLPWLAAFSLPQGVERFPARTFAKADGSSALQMKKLCPPPYCLEAPDGKGIAAYFPLEAANLTWDPCRNVELCDIGSREALERHSLHLRLSEAPAMVADIRLWPLRDGWRECFTRFREIIRSKVPDTQYRREDLDWIRQACLCHFTYAYSREFFRYETGKPDVAGLLAAGEAFGGYDAVLLWHEYPRLGLDARTQWDFYDDYPGGRAGMKAVVRELHTRGVRVLLPFKPWDRSAAENDRQTTARIAALIADLDIDGIFFDTMNTVPEAFRAAMDAARPGVVFVTESEPHEFRALEMITASWNQYRTDWPMPESNLMRFLFPKHTRHGISRWHVGAQKDMAVERAIFNGEGMVIWQDVFGAWLPYAEKQKAEIRRWKALWQTYGELLLTEDCVPLLTSRSPRIAANGFFAGDQAIVTLFLDGEAPYEGALLDRLPYATAVELRSGLPVRLSEGTLYGRLPGNRTAMVHLKR